MTQRWPSPPRGREVQRHRAAKCAVLFRERAIAPRFDVDRVEHEIGVVREVSQLKFADEMLSVALLQFPSSRDQPEQYGSSVNVTTAEPPDRTEDFVGEVECDSVRKSKRDHWTAIRPAKMEPPETDENPPDFGQHCHFIETPDGAKVKQCCAEPAARKG